MSTSKLPTRPSLESLRKQAKKLARNIVAGNADAIARARAQLPKAELALSQRDAQLVLAREYGFPGWKDLIKEVEQRLGRGLEWAVSEARHIIHDNDIDGLRQLLTEYPALLSWKADENDGGLLGIATGSFGDSGDAFREEHFTRKACAELLLDAGAVVAPSVCDGLIHSRARGLIDLFYRRGLLPRTLKFVAALGDVDGVRARLDTNAYDLVAVDEAFTYACHFEHATVAALLLDRSITVDAELGRRIDGGPGRSKFIQYFIENKPDVHDRDPFTPWQAFVKQHVTRAMDDGDLPSFVGLLRRDAWLLSDASVKFQIALIERTACEVPTPGCVWQIVRHRPDPHQVRHWFDAAGRPTLGDLAHHFPANDDWIRGNLEWGEPTVQQVLDTALALAVMNNHFEIADFLLAHGADINTNWSSHEPASILHELVWHKNYEAMQFLIDRGIDMTIKDHRWNSTAQGWAEYAAEDAKLARWLEEAERQRELRR